MFKLDIYQPLYRFEYIQVSVDLLVFSWEINHQQIEKQFLYNFVYIYLYSVVLLPRESARGLALVLVGHLFSLAPRMVDILSLIWTYVFLKNLSGGAVRWWKPDRLSGGFVFFGPWLVHKCRICFMFHTKNIMMLYIFESSFVSAVFQRFLFCVTWFSSLQNGTLNPIPVFSGRRA